MQDNKLTWRDVFDSDKKHYGIWTAANSVAMTAGYKYFLWNDRILIVNPEGRWQDTGLTVKDLA